MKQDTKKLVLIGGAALAALYAYSTMGGEDYAGMGGGGGLPLLPTLPEAAAGAAGAAAPIVYNFPAMPTPDWGTAENEGVVPKKTEVIPPVISTPIPTATADTKKFGGFYLSELQKAPISFFESDLFAQQTGLMTRERSKEVVGEMLQQSRKSGLIKSTSKTNIISKTVFTKKEAEKKALGSSKGGYSRMTNGGKTGWQQLGLSRPTAPGQPDRPRSKKSGDA